MQCFEHGGFSAFDRSLAWNVFASRAQWTIEGWALWYEKLYQGVLSIDDGDLITGISINRPGSLAFGDFYTVARAVPSLITWEYACAVADPRFLAGFPDWLLTGFQKPPAIVYSADQLMHSIARS